jgi:outer membrane protein assembly factor BamB
MGSIALVGVVAAALAFPPLGARAADWPRFQGPGASGISPETGLARTWAEGGPKVVWTIDVGPGFGGAAVRDGKVYLLDRVEDRRDDLRCLDLATGREEWLFIYDAPGTLPQKGSRQVPLVEEKYVYTVGPFGDLYCIDRATHQPAWSHHILRDFAAPAPGGDPMWVKPSEWWGVTQCPVSWKDTILVAPQTPKAGVVAYEKATGKVRWASPPVGPNWFSYVTPTLVRLCGTDQVLVFANKKPGEFSPAILSSLDAGSGQVLWSLETWKPYKLPISCPVQVGEDRLFISGAYGIGCFGLKVVKDGPKWSAAYTFKDNNSCVAHLHTPIFYKGFLYAQSFDIHGKKGQDGLVCLDPDGNPKWRSGPDQGFDAGHLLIADGLIFVLHGKTGELSLVEASPDGYKPLARAKVLSAEGGPVWAPMALADGKLIVRDQRQMKCLDVRKP